MGSADPNYITSNEMGTVVTRSEEPLGTEQLDLPPREEAASEQDPVPLGGGEDGAGKMTSGDRAAVGEEEERRRGREEEMREFREQLATKRAQRQAALDGLKSELSREREERLRLEAVLEEGGGSRAEVDGLERQVKALKDVAQIGGEMLRIRELQVNELKEKLKAIEETGAAYEKEVENMRKLRGLYEERSRAMAISHQMEVEREKARVVAAETRLEIAEEKNRELVEANKEVQERISSLDSTVDKNNNEISELKIQLAGKKEELYNANSQITIVNNLFSQLLTDPENLDRVTRVLQENHDLVNHLTEKGNINDVASVLMAVADKDRVLTDEEQDISTNLSKVWRLLVELLGYHSKQTTGETMPDSCYKSVDTPSGPKLVISVSQTFLRLKDLILEKNSLVKEVGRLKDLNCHLEERLISQESRLVEVAEELHKTWGVVNKLKIQHKAIHTQEQVLRYELKHKRLMLNELKQQLEECREMWQMARVKNNQTEKDWKILRKEFADRKHQISSAESGYEESPGDSQDEEDSHKMSDDESEIQDFPTSSSSRCLRISRLQDSELSTPDRSNSPEVQIMDLQNPDDVEDSEVSESLNYRTSGINQVSTVEAITEEPPGLDVPGTSVPNIEVTTCSISVSSDLAINDIKTDNLPSKQVYHVAHATHSTDELSIELEPTIQILPWNDTSDDSNQDQLPTIIEAANEEIVEERVESESPTGRSMTEETVASDNRPIPKVPDAPCSSDTMSNDQTVPAPQKPTAEEILARREARLKRLEEQCQHLFNKMSNTNKRSDIITSKLEELHEHYGESRNEPSTSQQSITPESASQASVQSTSESADPALESTSENNKTSDATTDESSEK